MRELSLREISMCWVVGLSVCLVFLNSFACPYCQGPLADCKEKLNSLASAINLYSTDHEGDYPRNLETLVPLYIKEIPNCPNASYQTYRADFEGQFLTLQCTGIQHEDVGLLADSPNYFQGGCTERPPIGSKRYLASSQNYPCPWWGHLWTSKVRTSFGG